MLPKLTVLSHNVTGLVQFGLSDCQPVAVADLSGSTVAGWQNRHPAAVQTNKSALIFINSVVQS